MRLTTLNPHTLAKQLLCVLVCLLLVTPLLFFPDYSSPFTNAKYIGFILLVELTLPVFLFVRLSGSRPHPPLRNPILISLLLVVLAMLVSAFTGEDPFNSFFGNAQRPTGVFFYLHLVLFVFILRELFCIDRRWKNLAIHLVISTATIASLYGLFESWLLPAFVSVDGRVASVFGNPTVFSGFLILPIFFALAQANEGVPRGKQLLFLASVGIMGSALLLSGTRGAVVGLLGGGLGWVIIKIWNRQVSRKQFVLLLVIVSLLLVGSVFFVRTVVAPEHPLYRLTNVAGANVQARLTYWNLGLKGWLEHPLLGVGNENFYVIADRYGKPSTIPTFTSYWPDKSHSALVGRLMATGILGMTLYVGFLFFLFCALLRTNMPAHHIWAAGLITYLIQGLFLFETVSGLIMMFFLVALTVNLESQRLPEPQTTKTRPLCAAMAVSTSAVGMGILLLIVTIPMHRLLLNIGQGNERLQDNPLVAFESYQSAESLAFIWDSRLLAKTYFTLLTTSVVQGDVPGQTLNELFEKTRTAFEQTLERHPQRAQDWNDFGRLFLLLAISQGGSVSEEGYEMVEQARSLAPSNPIPLETLTFMLLQDVESFASQGEYETVVARYQQLIDLHPDALSYLANLAAAYAKTGQTQKAIETAQLLLEQDPASAPSMEAFLESL